MKTTGIVRRIDELGRVVIPKEIRKTMHIKEGEELEVFVENEDTLVLKKYSTVASMKETSDACVNILRKNLGYNCIICDNDKCISAGSDKEFYENKRITKSLENFLKQRKSAFFRENEAFSIVIGSNYKDMIVVPIIVSGDVIGGLILVSKTTVSQAENLMKILEISAEFFAGQIA